MEKTRKKRRKRRNPIAVICNTAASLLLVILILGCGALTLPKVFGILPYTIVSGSMEPSIPTGSLVYVVPTDAEELQVGDVAAYYGTLVQEGAVITHRVTEIDTEARKLRTKGDANPQEDAEQVDFENVIGKVGLHIPGLGYLGALVSSARGKLLLLLIAAGACLLYLAAAWLDPQEAR